MNNYKTLTIYVISTSLGLNGLYLHLKVVNEVNKASIDKVSVSCFPCFIDSLIPGDFKVVFSVDLLTSNTVFATCYSDDRREWCLYLVERNNIIHILRASDISSIS